MRIILLTLLTLSASVNGESRDEIKVESVFLEGKRLIETNVGDAMGATREALEEGIRKIRHSFALGREPDSEAYRLMINAQRSITAIYTDSDPTDYSQSMESLRLLYEEALEVNPDDPDLLLEAADFKPGGKSREEILRRILEIDPEFSSARFYLGQILFLEGKDKVAGEAMMREAYRDATGREKAFRGRRLYAYLLQEGRKKEARKILDEIKDLPVE